MSRFGCRFVRQQNLSEQNSENNAKTQRNFVFFCSPIRFPRKQKISNFQWDNIIVGINKTKLLGHFFELKKKIINITFPFSITNNWPLGPKSVTSFN